MKILSKTVCATLFILSFCKILQAQISLDKIAYQTETKEAKIIQFYYESEKLKKITVSTSTDTTNLVINYKEGMYRSLRCNSNQIQENNFALSLRYTNGILDTIHYLDDQAIGLYTIQYDQHQRIRQVNQFVNQKGSFENTSTTKYRYTNDQEILVEKVEEETNAAFHQIMPPSETSLDVKPTKTNSSLKKSFEYQDDIIQSYIYTEIEENDLYPTQYVFDLEYNTEYDINTCQQPFEVLGLLDLLALFPQSAVLDFGFLLQSKHIPTEVSMNGDKQFEFQYSDPSIKTTLKESISAESSIIYPNPVRDYLYFKDDFQAEKVSIFDEQGALVCKMNYQYSNVNLSNLKDGNYILNAVDTMGNFIAIQFIKI